MGPRRKRSEELDRVVAKDLRVGDVVRTALGDVELREVWMERYHPIMVAAKVSPTRTTETVSNTIRTLNWFASDRVPCVAKFEVGGQLERRD
jgi:hypothetical protein